MRVRIFLLVMIPTFLFISTLGIYFFEYILSGNEASEFKSIFDYKKGSLGLGSSREKKEYLQAMAFLYIASCGGEARYMDVIEAIEIKIDSKIARRNIRGAIIDLKDRYPVEYLQNKQIEYICFSIL